MVEVLGIIAIIISSIAIILTTLKDFILPFFLKPRILIEGIDDEECIEDVSRSNDRSERWIRLRLVNKDSVFSKSAKNCYVKLLAIRNNKNGKKITPFNPIPLTWVHYDDYKGRRYNLSVGESHLIDLVHEKEYVSRIFCFKFFPPHDFSKNAIKKLGPGEYTFTVGVYGDNFKSRERDFEIKLTKKFGEINFI